MNILIFLYNLILLYWSDMLLVIVVAAALAILYKKGKKNLVKSIVKNLVVKAQRALGTETGILKYNQVVSDLYSALPFLIRVLFSKVELNTYIQDAVTWLNKKLEDPNINLLSYADEAIVKATESAPMANIDETIVVQSKKVYVDENGIELTPIVVPVATV
ncbi:hypothetical protein [Clostridium lacusfryxellense]|uniref:hypothetical protein n=1 Tax=Clostridium lacusfryxellense TaxID=205328 RepID=UPI001C0B7454|nr:hypothetical protein [Clostridium lacusfryxellense]MBU3112016.1 hypothetical protein [Clostridium lacusfryxellense]